MKCFYGYHKGGFMHYISSYQHEFHRRIGESYMERHASLYAFIASVFSTLTLHDVGVIVGIVTAIVTCLTNIYYKHKEMKHHEKYGWKGRRKED